MVHLTEQRPAGAILGGSHSEPQFLGYSDEEIAELGALMEREARIDLGFYDAEPLPAPDVDEGDGPERLELGDYWPAPEDPESL